MSQLRRRIPAASSGQEGSGQQAIIFLPRCDNCLDKNKTEPKLLGRLKPGLLIFETISLRCEV